MIKNSIVLVPFPFDDFSDSKVRPALCLTSEIGKYSQIIIAFISSRIPEDMVDSDVLISYQSEKSMGTGLVQDSVIRLHKIVTIPKSLIRGKLGNINKSVEIEVLKKLRHLFED
jgi:mRNA interferase MazF